MAVAPGTRMGPFVVDALLGEGGNAVVYRVHDAAGKALALKVLTKRSSTVRARLKREGVVQTTFRHRNVVRVLDTFVVGENAALVLELVDGPPLDRVLREVSLTPDQADDLARQILAGMSAVHQAGFVHRDLKPHNVMLSLADGRVTAKICDFGLVKLLDADGGDRLTHTGSTFGTPAYMAPEQVRDASRVDARADVWSLGALLQELVTGERAFQAPDTLELLRAVTRGTAQPLPDDMVPAQRAAIQASLTVDQGGRPAHAGALLTCWVAGRPAPEAPWSPEDVARLAALGAPEARVTTAKKAPSTRKRAADRPKLLVRPLTRPPRRGCARFLGLLLAGLLVGGAAATWIA